MSPFETTFFDVIDLIRREARRARKYNTEDIDELFAEASLHFVLAYKSFKQKKKVPFSQWVSYRISKALLSAVRRAVRRAELLPRVPLEDMPASEPWDIDAFVESLSDDGVTAVAAALETESKSAFRKRQEVVRTLKRMGWTRGRVRAAFAEVRTALEE